MSGDPVEADRVHSAPGWTERSAALVAEHGGQVLAGPVDTPAGGRMAIVLDPLGAVPGLRQTAGVAGFAPFAIITAPSPG